MIRYFVLLSLACFAAFGQEARGIVTGRVTDPSGAAVPNAKVEVINKAMGTKVGITANESGAYQASYLIPGAYRITVEAAGFKKYSRDNVDVRVNDQLEILVQLEVGTSEQTVTVTAEAPLLNTSSASMGTVIDGRRITDLPVQHGNPYSLIGLASGVSFTRDPRLDRPFEPTHIVGYTMDGTRANRSDVTLDGASSTATANAGEVISSFVPPADIVGEFKVQTATFDASFGNTEGGVTNISLKSGTNSFHGSAYYTKMAPELFANDFFANATRTPRPDFTYNRYGGSLGGPVWLPKLYNGKNRTFFMWGMEVIDEARPRNNGTPTVPTAAMKTGDFSQLLRLNSSYQIYNPFTRRAAAGGRFQQDPFPGNVVPVSLINPVSRNMLKFFPDPLQPGNADGTNNYQRSELVEAIYYITNSVRVDHTLSDKHRMFGRYSWYDRDSTYNNYFNNLATGSLFQFLSRQAVLDDVYMLSPSIVMNLRYGYNRFIRGDQMNPESHGFDLTSLGLPTAYNNAISSDLRRFPRIEMAGYQGTGFGADYRPIDTHSFVGSLQQTRGSHFLKYGMEFRAYRENSIPTGNDQTGRFIFDTTWTRGPLDNSPAAPGSLGQSVASMLLGLPAASSYVARNASYAEQSLSWGFYVHDDYKVNNKLTLNIGLRWEFDNPLTERYNRSVRGFDPNAAQPFAAQAAANYLARSTTPEVSALRTLGGLNFVGVGGNPRGVYDTPKRNLMPRFGVAYKLNDKTVIRTGYGVFFGFLGQRRGDVILSGFSRNTPFVPTLDNGLTFSNTLSNPFPSGILEPVGSAQGAQTFVGQGITYFDQKPVMPYMQRWQFGIQRELGAGYMIETAYVGNRGNRVEMGQNLNVTPQRYLSTSPVRDQARIDYLSANLPNPMAGLLPAGAIGALNGAQLGRERLLRPFPQFDSVNHALFDGYSWYHSAQINIEKRFSKGYLLSGNYTWSKYMQASERLNADDARPVEQISDADRPHRLTISGIYELPFGKGDMNRVAKKIVGGWQLSGISTYQTGAPINFGNLIYTGSNIRDMLLPDDQRSTARWFNGDGFERNAARQLAGNVRTFPLRFSFLRADNIFNWDLALTKRTAVAEGKNILFKAEFLNAFNHPLLPAPNTTVTQVQFTTIQASNQANYARRIQLNLRFEF